MNNKEKLLRLLSDLLYFVENSSEEDLAALRELSPYINRAGRQGRSEKREKADFGITEKSAEELILRVVATSSRDEAFRVLGERKLSKAALGYIARMLELPVVREDTSEMLVQKIVEGAIGARLNSAAIRGN